MYRELKIYVDSICDIIIHPWWKLANLHPELTRLISCTMSVLMGGQPAALQCNIGCQICGICGLRDRDGPEHILFSCPSLTNTRNILMQPILQAMPNAMREDFLCLDNFNKTQFLVSGMNCNFTIEWISIYKRILIWINEMYAERKKIYEDCHENTS